MTEFRPSYLAPESEPWVRELEQRVIALEKQLQISEQNRIAADQQLVNSYNRLDLSYQNLEELLLNTINTVEYVESTQTDLVELDVAGSWAGDSTVGIETVTDGTITILNVGAGGRKYILIARVNVRFDLFIDLGASSGAGQDIYLEIGDGTTYALYESQFGANLDVVDSESNVESYAAHSGTLTVLAEYDLTEGNHDIPWALKREGYDGNTPESVQGEYGDITLLIMPGPNSNMPEETLATTKIARK